MSSVCPEQDKYLDVLTDSKTASEPQVDAVLRKVCMDFFIHKLSNFNVGSILFTLSYSCFTESALVSFHSLIVTGKQVMLTALLMCESTSGTSSDCLPVFCKTRSLKSAQSVLTGCSFRRLSGCLFFLFQGDTELLFTCYMWLYKYPQWVSLHILFYYLFYMFYIACCVCYATGDLAFLLPELAWKLKSR